MAAFILDLSLQTYSGPPGSWQYCYYLYCLVCSVFSEGSVLHLLKHSAKLQVSSGLRRRTSQAYKFAFRFVLAFLVFTDLVVPYVVETVVMFLKFLAVNGYRACLLKKLVSILHHYFSLLTGLQVPYMLYR